jgi:hypothetical protein
VVAGSRLPVAAGQNSRDPRRGKTRTGGRRSCTFLVLLLFAATLLMADVVQAVVTPEDGDLHDPLKNATTSCLSETADGSCPTFAFASVGIGKKIKQVTNPAPETNEPSKNAIPAALERNGECKMTNSLFKMTHAVGAFKVGDNIKTFTAAENPMKNAPIFSLPSLLIVPREPVVKWMAAATHPTFTDHPFELGSSGHNAAVYCARVVVPGKEKNTSVLPKIFEDLKPSRNCTIAIAAPQQRIEKTNSQKLIEKKRKARQKYMNEYMNEKGRPFIPSKLSQYLVTGDSPLSNFDQNVQLVLTCLSVLIQMCLIGVAGMTLPVAL